MSFCNHFAILAFCCIETTVLLIVSCIILSNCKDPYPPASMMEHARFCLKGRSGSPWNQQIPWCCASAARTRRSIKRQCPGHNLHWLVMLLSNLSNLSFRMWESCMDMSSYHVIYLQSSLCCLVLAQKLEGAIYFEWKHCWERMSSSLKIWNFCLFGPSSCGHHNTKSWLLSTSWLDARRHTHGCWLAEVMLVQGLVEDVYKTAP